MPLKSKNKVNQALKTMGLDITLSAIDVKHNAGTGNTTFEILRPGLEKKIGDHIKLKLETPLGIDSNGAYASADLKAGAKYDFKLLGTSGCFSADVGLSASADGNHQMFAETKAMMDVAKTGFQVGVIYQALKGSKKDNSRTNTTTSGSPFYGPGHFVGVGIQFKR